MSFVRSVGLVFFLLVLSGIAAGHARETGYYTSPTVHDRALVFVSEGDLWWANAAGGPATRLTTHAEVEADPALSPDGTEVAFTGNYDGAQEVYVMRLGGGAPRQLTFEGNGVAVRGWTPDGRVLFVSSNEPGTRPRVLRTVDPATLQVETLPLLDADHATYSGDGARLFFTRYGLSLSADNARLYRGGRMAQLWRYTLGSDAEAVRLAADFGAPIRSPMWWQGRIYFVSDKSGDDNIWSVDENGGTPTQHSQFAGWQVREPELSNGKITYQRGADIHVFDIASASDTQLQLNLVTDRDAARLRWIEEPLAYVEASGLSGTGTSVALTARGNVAVAFTGNRRRVELAIPETARARNAVLGPKGEWVYLILDQDSIGEIWRYPADGRGTPQQLTRGSDAHIWEVSVAPDGESLVYDDKRARLWKLDIEDQRKTLLETSASGDDGPFSGFAWSAHGRYLAFSAPNSQGLQRVILRDMQEGTRAVVTGEKYAAYAPAFAPDGDWLYFISDRNFSASPSAPWGDRNMGPAFDKRGRLYGLQLQTDAQFPFRESDELRAEAPAAEDTTKSSRKSRAKADDTPRDKPVAFDGLAARVWDVPVAPDNYTALKANEGFLYALVDGGESSRLVSISIDSAKAEVETFAGDVNAFDLSLDGKLLSYAAGRGPKLTLAIVPAKAKAPQTLNGYRVRVGDWRLAINPRSEWRQMFLDAWRLHRDFAFDPAMRGVDWPAVRDKYLPLVARIGHRDELNDLLGQMSAEIGILHSQIGSGDQPEDAESADVAALGAVFEPVPGGLRVATIYRGDVDLIDRRGPLLQPGVDVREGDVLSAVDGRAVSSAGDLARALRAKAGQQVRLDLKRGGDDTSAIVSPVPWFAARQLRYDHWVEMNRRAVATAGGGDIGYLHLAAMGGNDIASFARDFYEHVGKDGLIIDVRGNRGGNIDSWIIGTLLRRVWAFWESPLGGEPSTNMQQTFRGHLVVLINEGTYSDGETFAAGIKALDLATLIGTRTAGAGIWLSDRNRLADNGIARIAEYAQYGLDGRWLIEGQGVAPDIAVINPPHASFAGQDAQLEAAISYLQRKMSEQPVPALKARALPPVGGRGQDVD